MNRTAHHFFLRIAVCFRLANIAALEVSLRCQDDRREWFAHLCQGRGNEVALQTFCNGWISGF